MGVEGWRGHGARPARAVALARRCGHSKRLFAALGAVVLSACATLPRPSTRNARPAVEPSECTAALRLEEAPVAAPIDDVPRTRISLVLLCRDEGRSALSIGDEVGACTPTEPRPGALLAAHCWWGPRGAMLEVVSSGPRLVVRRAEVGPDGRLSTWGEAAELPAPDGARIAPL